MVHYQKSISSSFLVLINKKQSEFTFLWVTSIKGINLVQVKKTHYTKCSIIQCLFSLFQTNTSSTVEGCFLYLQPPHFHCLGGKPCIWHLVEALPLSLSSSLLFTSFFLRAPPYPSFRALPRVPLFWYIGLQGKQIGFSRTKDKLLNFTYLPLLILSNEVVREKYSRKELMVVI